MHPVGSGTANNCFSFGVHRKFIYDYISPTALFVFVTYQVCKSKHLLISMKSLHMIKQLPDTGEQNIPAGVKENRLFAKIPLMKFGFSSAPLHVAYNPSQSLMALGFKTHCIIFGNGTEMRLQIPKDAQDGDMSALYLMGRYCICNIGNKVVSFNIATSEKTMITSFDSRITASCVLSSWMVVAVNGQVEMVHIKNGQVSDYLIPNQISQKSSISFLQINSFDPNILLILYTNGIAVVWDLRGKHSISKYEYQSQYQSIAASWCPKIQNCFVVL